MMAVCGVGCARGLGGRTPLERDSTLLTKPPMRTPIFTSSSHRSYSFLVSAIVWAALALLTLVGSACGGDDTPANTGEPPECQDGVTYSCSRLGCSTTAQSCVDGKLGLCRCLDSTSGGTTGSGGSTAPDAGMNTGGSMKTGGTTATGGSMKTGGTTATGGMSDTGGTTATGGMMVVAEVCDNGIDDDDDGTIDCDDLDCTDVMCVDAAPANWTGPVAVADVTSIVAACDGTFSDTLFEGGRNLTADPASCSSCSCTPGTCASTVDLLTSTATDCMGTTCTTSLTTNTTCAGAVFSPSCLGGGAISAGVELLTPGGETACTPGTQAPTLPEASFDNQAAVCGLSKSLQRGGCERGRLCAPVPATPFGQTLCIVQDGDHACPAGNYSVKTLYYTDFDDTRACTDCGCNTNCSYTLDVYDGANNACDTVEASITTANQCAVVDTTSGSLRVEVQVTGNGVCENSGGVAQGSVTPTAPFTVCCEP